MSMVLGWERVQEDLGLDEAPMTDPQEWEEMVSLLSFDGEEHKKVTRYVCSGLGGVEGGFYQELLGRKSCSGRSGQRALRSCCALLLAVPQ